MLTHHPRKDLMIEGEFLPETVDDLIELRERIAHAIKVGDVEEVTPKSADVTANALVGWLVGKAAGETDSLSAPTRSRYRRILTKLAAVGGDGGYATTGSLWSLSTSMGAAGALAATGHPLAAILAAPIIYEQHGYVRPERHLAAVS